MPKHNNIIPESRFKKSSWKFRVRANFNLPMKAKARKMARAQKAAEIFPRPIELLRPVVRCPGAKNNFRIREGRGFSVAELQAAGIQNVSYARSIGIAVDVRRVNKSEESKQTNVDRLKTYMSKLVLFPLKEGKPRKGDATKEQIAAVTAATASKRSLAVVQPAPAVELVTITEEQKKAMKAVAKLRRARAKVHRVGLKLRKKDIVVEGAKTEESNE